MRYVVLMAGILMLLSVVVPHHHHRDGMPCYHSLMAEQEQDGSCADTYGCGCDGHNLAYFHSSSNQMTDGDVDSHWVPLLVLFDYVYPPELAFFTQVLGRERPWYIESSHDTWIVEASGLRAPPRLSYLP